MTFCLFYFGISVHHVLPILQISIYSSKIFRESWRLPFYGEWFRTSTVGFLFYLGLHFFQGDWTFLWSRTIKIKKVMLFSSDPWVVWNHGDELQRYLQRKLKSTSYFWRLLYRAKIFWTLKGIPKPLKKSCYAFEIHFSWPSHLL